LLVELVQLMMLNIKYISMMSTLTIGISYLPQVTIMVFLTSVKDEQILKYNLVENQLQVRSSNFCNMQICNRAVRIVGLGGIENFTVAIIVGYIMEIILRYY